MVEKYGKLIMNDNDQYEQVEAALSKENRLGSFFFSLASRSVSLLIMHMEQYVHHRIDLQYY